VIVNRIGIALSGVGASAVTWDMAVLAGLAEEGVDPRTAHAIIGTSAGAAVATRIAMGAEAREEAEHLTVEPPPVPSARMRRAAWSTARRAIAIWSDPQLDERERRRRIGALALEGSRKVGSRADRTSGNPALPPGPWPDRLRVSAVDARSGDRVVLDAACGASLDEVIDEARSLPGVASTVSLGERVVTDAALVSGANADVLADGAVDSVLVLTTASLDDPLDPDDERRALDRLWNAHLEREVAALGAHRVPTLVVRPSTEARLAMGSDFTRLDDPPAVVEAGIDQGRRVACLLSSCP
jgi:NTE family protein